MCGCPRRSPSSRREMVGRTLAELTQVTRLGFQYDWGLPPRSLPTRRELELALCCGRPVGNLWNIPQYTNLTSLRLANNDGDTYLGHLTSLNLGPLMACCCLKSLTLELYCRVQSLPPLLPRLTRLVMTGIGEMRVRDVNVEHFALWLADTCAPPSVPPRPPVFPGSDTQCPAMPAPANSPQSLAPGGLPSGTVPHVPPPAGSRNACPVVHCDQVRRVQEQWRRKEGRPASRGWPEEATARERAEGLEALAREQPLRSLREVCFIYKALDASFVAQTSAAMGVPIQAALFEEVSKGESLLAGVIDNEVVPRGAYHVLYTTPHLLGECGARLLTGCREVQSGVCLSKQHLFSTYGL
eukprot:jgi/Botrbrau1/6045/Bobra.0042s0028.1